MGDFWAYDAPFIWVTAFASAVLAFFGARVWKVHAQRRGGVWQLELLMVIMVPATTLTVAFYPQDGSFSGPFPVLNRALSLLGVVIALWAIAEGMRQPRRRVSWIILGVVCYYGALVLSGTFGYIPGLPEQYLTTPIIIVAFLVRSDYRYEWLSQYSRLLLRIVVAASMATTIVLPWMAFNTEESRTFFGVARLQGIFGHPNGLAYAAAVLLILEVGMRSRLRWWILPVAALLLAQSNAGYAIASICVLWILIRTKVVVLMFAVVSLVGAVVLSILDSRFNGIFWNFFSDENTTDLLNGRQKIWSAAMEGFNLNPVFGYGSNLLDSDFRALYLPNFDAAGQAHGQWYQTLGGAGIIGAAGLMIFTLISIVYAIRKSSATGGVTVALVVSIALRGLVESPLQATGPSIQTFYIAFVVGLLASARGPFRSHAGHLDRTGPSDPPEIGASQRAMNFNLDSLRPVNRHAHD